MTQSDQKPNGREAAEVMLLLPWYDAGSLNRRDRERVEAVLPHYPELSEQLRIIREERAEAVHLNETFGAPSAAVADRLMAAIDAEAPRARVHAPAGAANWLTGFFANLSPRTLAVGASFAVLAIGVQSVMIANLAVRPRPVEYRGLEPPQAQVGTFAAVRFSPKASATDITELLQTYRAAIVDGPSLDGSYRIRLAAAALSKDELGRLMHRFRQESVVESAEWVAPNR